MAIGTSPFVGRTDELRLLSEAFADASGGTPRIVLVRGPAGIGKTSLLNAFAASHDVTMHVSGDHAEMLLAFGVVDQMLAQAGRSRDRGSDAVVDPPAVGAELLSLFASSATTGCAIVMVDDVQWVDAPSLQSILFAIRRLIAEQVLLVFTCRDESLADLPDRAQRAFADPRVVQIGLDGLDQADIRQLFALVGHEPLPIDAARRLHEQTEGHPLYALELLRELPTEVLTGHSSSPLPVPRTYAALVVNRLGQLDPETVALAEAASILGMSCRVEDAATLAGIRRTSRAVDALVSRRWVTLTVPGQQIQFVHPLLRAAIYHGLNPGRRAALHAHAARMAETKAASLQHRILAAVGINRELAEELVAFGTKEEERDAWASAAEAFFAAERLHPVAQDREQCMMRAAECLLMAGRGAAAAAMLPRIEAASSSARRDQLLGFVAMLMGDRTTSRQLLQACWTTCQEREDRELAAKAAFQLSMVALTDGHARDALDWAHRSLQLDPPLGSRGTIRSVMGSAYGELGALDEGLASLGDLPSALTDFDAESLGIAVGRGVLYLFHGLLKEAVADLRQADEAARRGIGAFSQRVNALFHLADAEYRLGRWDQATLHAGLATSLGDDSGAFLALGLAHAIAAAPAAGRGDWDRAESHIRAAEVAAQTHGDAATRVYVSLATARLAMARAEPAAAVDALETILALDHPDGWDEPGVQPWQPLYGEALVGVGRISDAEQVAARLLDLATARGNRHALLAAHRVRGLAAAASGNAEDAVTAFAMGLAYGSSLDHSLQEALLHQDHGRALLRIGADRAGLDEFVRARGALTRLAAQPYLARCAQELAVAGVGPTVPFRADPCTRLTPQELAVVTLVSAGLTNRLVAAELVISIKTVEYHLGHVFEKLNVSSRTMLTALLRSGGTDADPTRALR